MNEEIKSKVQEYKTLQTECDLVFNENKQLNQKLRQLSQNLETIKEEEILHKKNFSLRESELNEAFEHNKSELIKDVIKNRK